MVVVFERRHHLFGWNIERLNDERLDNEIGESGSYYQLLDCLGADPAKGDLCLVKTARNK